MFEPNNRTLLTDALRAPSGYHFEEAIATTFSLDLTTLLTIPVHLTLFGATDTDALLKNPIALMDSLRKTTQRISVFCQRGRIRVPEIQHVLYGYLEPVIHEVLAPQDGVFHAKLWVLRYLDVGDPTNSLTRLLILSRNLTSDRSWDVCLQLEGIPRGRRLASNKELAGLIAQLPDLGLSPHTQVSSRARRLADEVHRCVWDLPEGYDQVWFYTCGLEGEEPYEVAYSDRLAVISPFIRTEALQRLVVHTADPAFLLSRDEELANISPQLLSKFGNVSVLRDETQTEDGEETVSANHRLRGLHAKVYVEEFGAQTHVSVGSANATNAVFRAGSNVEILATLEGYRRHVGGIDDLKDALGQMLFPFETSTGTEHELEEEDDELNKVRNALTESELSLVCEPDKSGWRLNLAARNIVPEPVPDRICFWPVSIKAESDSAADGLGLWTGEVCQLRVNAAESVTGLVAFELGIGEDRLRFVLNLPISGIPEGRDGAILKTVLQNRDGLLRYLMLILSGMDDAIPFFETAGTKNGWWGDSSSSEDFPLLEELARAFSRDPDRLREIGSVITRLRESDETHDWVPAELLELWDTFEQARRGLKRNA